MISEVVVRQLWDETPDAMLAVSADGQVVHWNRAAETIFGYSAKEAMGRRLTELIVPRDREQEEQKIQAEALAGRLAVYESVRRRKDGSLVHVSVSSKVVRDPESGATLVLSTKKDVTHLKTQRDAKMLEV